MLFNRKLQNNGIPKEQEFVEISYQYKKLTLILSPGPVLGRLIWDFP